MPSELSGILAIARGFIGVKEVPGAESNPRVVAWLYRFARNVKMAFIAKKGDEIAWCAVFVSMVLDKAGYRGTDHALASSYITWGKPTRFKPGAVVVIKRKKKGRDKRTGSRAGYHVGFFEQITKNYVVLTGGNQRNQVRKSWYPRSAYEVIAVRKPNEV